MKHFDFDTDLVLHAKFSDKQAYANSVDPDQMPLAGNKHAWANSADPDQTPVRRLIWVYTVCQSSSNLDTWKHGKKDLIKIVFK